MTGGTPLVRNDIPDLAALFSDLTSEQADGLACIVCGARYMTVGTPHVPVGRSATTRSQVFACVEPCAPAVGYVPPAGGRLALDGAS